MATKFYNVQKAAEVLGISPAEVNQLREELKLHGYRDGADWKFKAEEVDALVSGASDNSSSESDVDFDLDGIDLVMDNDSQLASGPGNSGTVVASQDVDFDGSGLDIDLTDSSLLSSDSAVVSISDSSLDLESTSSTGSSLLQMAGDDFEDDDLVLGGSGGVGSDIGGSSSKLTLGGDSGIMLIDPTDSGLSLEEPLDLDENDAEDSLLSLAEGSVLGANVDNDDDFLLSDDDIDGDVPVEEDSEIIVLEEEDESSGIPSGKPAGSDISGFDLASSEIGLGSSEVGLGSSEIGLAGSALGGSSSSASVGSSQIGLGSEIGLGSGVGLGSEIGLGAMSGVGGSQVGMASGIGMFDENMAEADGFGAADSAGMFEETGTAAAATAMQTVADEAPIGGGWIFFLVLSNLALSLVLMLMYDLVRNMWSWNQAFTVNSWLMDMILGK